MPVPSQSPKKFATDLFNEWGIGRAEKNNGVLVLVVKDARRIEIEVGDGAVNKFSRTWTEQMIEDKVLPSFKSGKFSKGLERCVDACAARLAVSDEQIRNDDIASAVVTAGIYGLGLAFGGGRGGGGYGGGGGSGSSGGGGGGGGSW